MTLSSPAAKAAADAKSATPETTADDTVARLHSGAYLGVLPDGWEWQVRATRVITNERRSATIEATRKHTGVEGPEYTLYASANGMDSATIPVESLGAATRETAKIAKRLDALAVQEQALADARRALIESLGGETSPLDGDAEAKMVVDVTGMDATESTAALAEAVATETAKADKGDPRK